MKIKIALFFTLLFSCQLLEGFGQRFIFYLHGKIVENQGPNAVDTVNGYGAYEYVDIIDSLKKRNFTVISEVRKPNTSVTAYASLLTKQIDSLLKKGIGPENITVIGASKGAIIAMFVSAYSKNKKLNFVFIGACDDELYDKAKDIVFYGNILSIYEKSDVTNGQSCIKFKNKSSFISQYKEIALNTGLRHGFLYKPISEWLVPAVNWANENYNFHEDETLSPRLKITHLTGNYYVYTTYNTYKNSLTDANGLYVLTTEGVVMIDTPWDTTQFQPLFDSIERKHHQKVILGIATHSHEDRTAGLKFLNEHGVKTFTTIQTDALSKNVGAKRANYTFKNDTTFRVGSCSFQACYPGEGHTKDNIVIWFEKEKVLYGGCLIKSTEATDLGYIGEANLKAWPATLNFIKHKFSNPAFIIPGHQGWSSVRSVDHTLNLLKQPSK